MHKETIKILQGCHIAKDKFGTHENVVYDRSINHDQQLIIDNLTDPMSFIKKSYVSANMVNSSPHTTPFQCHEILN